MSSSYHFLLYCTHLDLENQHFIIKLEQKKKMQYLKFQKFNFPIFRSDLLPSPLNKIQV